MAYLNAVRGGRTVAEGGSLAVMPAPNAFRVRHLQGLHERSGAVFPGGFPSGTVQFSVGSPFPSEGNGIIQDSCGNTWVNGDWTAAVCYLAPSGVGFQNPYNSTMRNLELGTIFRHHLNPGGLFWTWPSTLAGFTCTAATGGSIAGANFAPQNWTITPTHGSLLGFSGGGIWSACVLYWAGHVAATVENDIIQGGATFQTQIELLMPKKATRSFNNPTGSVPLP